jgi:23S rRNA (uridine2552-2'-O)-methyltransferase
MSSNYNRKDHHYKSAKEQGYRSRAAFKLIEMDNKHNLLRPGFKVLDLGAWPGGWLQVAANRVSSGGLVVGIDLEEIEALPFYQVKTIKGNVSDEHVLSQAQALAAGEKFDLLLSDMSHKLTGIKEIDNTASASIGEMVLFVSSRLLKPGGNVVIKLFKGGDTGLFVKNMRKRFNKVKISELSSSRKTSKEFYVLGFGYILE